MKGLNKLYQYWEQTLNPAINQIIKYTFLYFMLV